MSSSLSKFAEPKIIYQINDKDQSNTHILNVYDVLTYQRYYIKTFPHSHLNFTIKFLICEEFRLIKKVFNGAYKSF